MKTARTLAALALVFLISLSLPAQQSRTIPEGTQVQIRMIDSLTSENAREGQAFHATLDAPIVVNDRTLVPKGADVTGTVTRVHASGRLSDPGELELVLTSVSSGSRSYPINTQPWSIKGESHAKSNVGKIGGGTALGAIIGGIAGGGKGAAIGAGVGAGAGTATAAATGKKEAKVESEAVIAFVTSASVEQYASAPAGQYSGAPAEPYATPAAKRESDVRDEDTRQVLRPRPFRTEFTNYDRQNIRGCFVDGSISAGLAGRDSLPPGLERQVQRDGTLPPGLQRRAQALPDSCSARLPRLPADWTRVVLGRRVLLLDPDNRITDLFNLDDEE